MLLRRSAFHHWNTDFGPQMFMFVFRANCVTPPSRFNLIPRSRRRKQNTCLRLETSRDNVFHLHVKQLIFHMIMIYFVRGQVVMKKWQLFTRAQIWLTTIFWTIDAWKQERILLLKINTFTSKAAHSCEESALSGNLSRGTKYCYI